MASLGFLIERLSKSKDSNKEEKIKEIISFGKNIRDDFWDDFILLLNDPDGLSALLGISEDEIFTWHSKIKKYLNNKDYELEIYKKRRKILKN
jgi:hypothetical protein